MLGRVGEGHKHMCGRRTTIYHHLVITLLLAGVGSEVHAAPTHYEPVRLDFSVAAMVGLPSKAVSKDAY